MNCDRAETLLQCYFDNELDALNAAKFKRHLGHCSQCVDALERLNSLRSAMDQAKLFESAPDSLRKKVLASVSSPGSASVVPLPAFWRWLAIAATLLLLIDVSRQAVSFHRVANFEPPLAAEIVDAHLRSLQPGHLNDVISSDQHTVKPWFAGKLDFSPPVRDFADRGFPLEGGRLDVIHGRSVAALIYGRRKHLVNVFMWPTNEPDAFPRAGSRQGYHWLDWRRGGMEFYTVSDAALPDLEQLQRGFTE